MFVFTACNRAELGRILEVYMEIETVHFGNVEINDGGIITFPEGVPGFEDVHRFILLGNVGEKEAFFWMQSVDKPDVCFVVTDPFVIYNNYNVDVDDDDIAILEINGSENVLTLVIVVVPDNIEDARVNLKAPVIINMDKKIGMQVLQKNESLPIRYYFNRR